MSRLGAAVVGVGLALFVLAVVATGGAAAQEEQVTLTINVTDSNGDPIDDVTVVATWDDGEEDAQAMTASNGRTFIDVPAGADVDITVEHEDYVRNLQPVEVEDAEEQEVDIRMSLAGTVEFEVADVENGEPVEDARLIVRHPGNTQPVEVVRTGSDGTVELEDIEQREYEVVLSRAQYFNNQETFTLESSLQTESYEMERGFTRVDFMVNDTHFDPPRPLGDARVEIEETGDVLTTRSDGIQDTRLPVNDDYTINVTKQGYDGVTRTLELGEQRQTFTVGIERTPSISVEPLNDAVVVGETTQISITNAYDEPVENAAVTLNGNSLGQSTAAGTVQFEVTETGENEIVANYRGLSDTVIIEGVERGEDPDDNGDGDPDDGTTDDDGTDDQMDDDDDEMDNGSTGGDDEEDADSLGPGFGVVAAAVALLGAGLLARRRR